MKNEDIEIMNSIRWWHEIELEPGVFTPNAHKKNLHTKATTIYGMPERLDNKTVLDIGAWDGGFSFEAEKRGAKRVLATDIYQNQSVGNVRSFEFAKRILNSSVEFQKLSVYDLNPNNIGKFDVVLFYGVLYHLDDILTAMTNIFNVTNEFCILETAMTHNKALINSEMPFCEWCMWSSGDKYNRWFPNYAFIEKIAKDVGFKRIERVFAFSNDVRATFKLYK